MWYQEIKKKNKKKKQQQEKKLGSVEAWTRTARPLSAMYPSRPLSHGRIYGRRIQKYYY